MLAIVAAAVLRIGRKALKTPLRWSLAAAAFIAIFFLRVPFPLIVFSALALGFFLPAEIRQQDDRSLGAEPAPGLRRSLLIVATCLALWWTPVALMGLWQGWHSALFQEGVFFSKTAIVTFGGAYAVLPYVAQHAHETYGWLQSGQMVDGLGLAETTPGPLIMVLQFVGFMGGWNHPGALPPLLAATLGAVLTTWVTFVPCFLWIFLGAPYVEKLRDHARLRGALGTVTAAVVGVILNLAVWFGWQVLFPGGRGFDWFAGVLAAIALAGMVRWRWGVIPVVLGCGVAGVLHRFVA